MKNLILICALAYAGYFAYQKYDAYHVERNSDPYIAVYGRDSCGYTSNLRTYLDSVGANYEYYSIDDKASADRLHAKMKNAGISTRRYNLPVVDVSGEISVRPDPREVVSKYRSAPL